MQGSVHTYDDATGATTMILDDGLVVGLTPDALQGSGIRHLRVGQRLSLVLDEFDGTLVVTRAWIVGIGDGEVIH